jgi:hypothetical protein
MTEQVWGPARRSSKPSSSTIKAQHTSTTRLQLELLEKRDVPAVLVDLGDAPTAADSLFMQTPYSSAFYGQSAVTGSAEALTPEIGNSVRLQDRAVESAHPLWNAATSATEHLETEWEEPIDSLFRMLPFAPSLRMGAGGMIRLAPAESRWPAHVYAPYVEIGAWPPFDLVDAAATEGIRHFNLAFITANSQSRPSWDGNDRREINDNSFDTNLRQQIADLRAMGGDVAVSFGGPHGSELAQSITDVDALKNAYKAVVQTYALKRIDFDLQGSALDDVASIERRSQALAQLQTEMAKAAQPVEIWFSLPAEPSGLSESGMNVIRSALRNGVQLGGVNVKTMNFSASTAPYAEGTMGVHAIQSGLNAFYQLQRVMGPQQSAAEIWGKMGLTPMIGANDVAGEKFYPQDAQLLQDFARQQGVGMIGIWSLNRDQSCAQPSDTVQPASSGIVQDAFEFSNIFLPSAVAPSK